MMFSFRATSGYDHSASSLTGLILSVSSSHELNARPSDSSLPFYCFTASCCQVAGLRNASVTLTLYWDHMPLTGTLYMHSVAVDTFEVPGEYRRR